MSKKCVLVVEDDEDILNLIKHHLQKDGYEVLTAENGTEALHKASSENPDLVILDIMLPEVDGLEVCRRLRSNKGTASTPILMLSAKKEELDKVLGLELGADDYMIKPFSVRELMARVKALLRRAVPAVSEDIPAIRDEYILKAGHIVIYPERHQVEIHGQNCILTHKEFILLQTLMANAGKVLTRDILLDKVWGYETDVDTRTVDVHIRSLRQKVEDQPANPEYIITVRSVGYRFADRKNQTG